MLSRHPNRNNGRHISNNNVRQATYPPNTTFTYNGLGDRLTQTVGGQTTPYTLDLAAGLTQVLHDDTHTYLYGNMRLAQNTSTTTEYFLPDALGSVRQLVDETGPLTLAQAYQPLPFAQGRLYGETLHSSGSGASPYGFAGEYTDRQTGLQYLRARDYAPGVGRFLTKDAWAGDALRPMSLNGWVYGDGNPVRYTDPSGHIPCEMLPLEDQAACYSPPEPPTSVDIPPSGVMFLPASNYPRPMTMYRGWGNGKFDSWNTSKPIPPGTYQAQLQIDGSWTGLCGAISVAAILKVTHPAIVANEVIKQLFESALIGDANYPGAGDMAYVLNTYYGSYWNAKSGYINNFVSEPPKYHTSGGRNLAAQSLRNWLQNNSFVIAGVCANGSTGKLTEKCGISHWVVITGISSQWIETPWNASQNWVRIYNPFNNQTEFYRWGHFKEAWENDGNMMVLATKKAQPPLLPPPGKCVE